MTPETERELEEWALLLKTLGHPVRLRIAIGLAKESACVMEIWECLEMPQAVVSQHLKVMKEKGLVVSCREGTRVRYELGSERIAELVRVITRNSSLGLGTADR
ncbi:ArsR/SmtB family transcription factor [Pelotalea chapellei]|uniref:Winged helix-turn-helix domain-containing protein n=1 Tax=Pelotalea chapellei TaxID=44671 RepID=A0ABS5UAJ0_9BACT|nr:metalloregulator ArsR/SmtB family transcription factor [Pelotalea chapellei]MBT1072673.1 winged helix-turn-helix domain-containing protein [Pelotalea chapellei]